MAASPSSLERELAELFEQRVRHEAEVHSKEDAADALGQLEATEGGDTVDADERAEKDDREGHQIGGVDLGGGAGGGWAGGVAVRPRGRGGGRG